MIPHILIYTDNLPDGVAGCTNAFVIRIRPEYEGDKGLLAHELEHVRQWWVTAGLHSLLYLFVRKYRQWSEVKAYRIQMEHGLTLDKAAWHLAGSKYKLGISIQQAKELLSGN